MQTTSAELVKHVHKTEIVDTILQLQRENPRITNLELAVQLKCHRNTISKYVNYIRKTYHKSPVEIVNRIDNRLEEEINTMPLKALLTYRYQLVPKQEIIQEEITHTENVNINVKSLLAEYENLISEDGTQETNLSANNPAQPIHKTEANSETSAIPVT